MLIKIYKIHPVGGQTPGRRWASWGLAACRVYRYDPIAASLLLSTVVKKGNCLDWIHYFQELLMKTKVSFFRIPRLDRTQEWFFFKFLQSANSFIIVAIAGIFLYKFTKSLSLLDAIILFFIVRVIKTWNTYALVRFRNLKENREHFAVWMKPFALAWPPKLTRGSRLGGADSGEQTR